MLVQGKCLNNGIPLFPESSLRFYLSRIQILPHLFIFLSHIKKICWGDILYLVGVKRDQHMIHLAVEDSPWQGPPKGRKHHLVSLVHEDFPTRQSFRLGLWSHDHYS